MWELFLHKNYNLVIYAKIMETLIKSSACITQSVLSSGVIDSVALYLNP